MALPKAVVKRIMTDSAGGMRVSGSALDAAVAAAEDYLGRLGKAASESAESGTIVMTTGVFSATSLAEDATAAPSVARSSIEVATTS